MNLPTRIGLSAWWQCRECGEMGRFRPGLGAFWDHWREEHLLIDRGGH